MLLPVRQLTLLVAVAHLLALGASVLPVLLAAERTRRVLGSDPHALDDLALGSAPGRSHGNDDGDEGDDDLVSKYCLLRAGGSFPCFFFVLWFFGH